MGRAARLRAPRPLVGGVVRAFRAWHGISLEEAQVPTDGFESFDAFFTRRLQPGARPLDPRPGAVHSPADGRIDAMGAIEPGARVRVKGVDYGLGELFRDEEGVARLQGGAFVVVYLSPRDYHRVHLPFDCTIEWVEHVPGARWPVNALGWRMQPRLLARNERVVARLRGERHGVGYLAMVAAWGVGHIEVVVPPGTPAPGERLAGNLDTPLAAGDEFGVFHLGSTVVLGFERTEGLAAAVRVGAAVRMGEALWAPEER